MTNEVFAITTLFDSDLAEYEYMQEQERDRKAREGEREDPDEP